MTRGDWGDGEHSAKCTGGLTQLACLLVELVGHAEWDGCATDTGKHLRDTHKFELFDTLIQYDS